MRVALILLTFSLVVPGWASEPIPQKVRVGDIEFSARLVVDVDEIEKLTGDRLDEEFSMVELTVRPLFDNMLELSREDFIFRCRCDNERSEAVSPDMIAGTAVLALENKRTSRGGVFSQAREAVIAGGAPGTGTRPTRIDNAPSSFGSATTGESETTLQAQNLEDDSLLGRLNRLEMSLDPVDEPVTGYLFFQVDPQRRLKHYVLSYDGVYGEFQMTFDK